MAPVIVDSDPDERWSTIRSDTETETETETEPEQEHEVDSDAPLIAYIQRRREINAARAAARAAAAAVVATTTSNNHGTMTTTTTTTTTTLNGGEQHPTHDLDLDVRVVSRQSTQSHDDRDGSLLRSRPYPTRQRAVGRRHSVGALDEAPVAVRSRGGDRKSVV